MARHYRFKDIQNLDSELDSLNNAIEMFAGKVVDQLPPANKTAERARFYVKQTDGSYKQYVKLNNEFILL
jgi:hypothetical protein